MNFHELQRLESLKRMQGLLAVDEDGNGPNPTFQETVAGLLPKDDEDLRTRFEGMLGAVWAVHYLLQGVETRMEVERQRLDQSLRLLERRPAASEEGKEQLQTLRGALHELSDFLALLSDYASVENPELHRRLSASLEAADQALAVVAEFAFESDDSVS